MTVTEDLANSCVHQQNRMNGDAVIKKEPGFITDDYVENEETSEGDGTETKLYFVKEEAVNTEEEPVNIKEESVDVKDETIYMKHETTNVNEETEGELDYGYIIVNIS